MRNSFLFLVSVILLYSCKPTTDKVETYDTGLKPLMLYYPLDSTGPNGEKLFHQIPDVKLTAQSGKIFSTASSKGKVALADFFFANCQGICPRMTAQFTRVQDAFKNNAEFQMISYTVDPDRDSAETLQAYADRFKADTAQWKFVTGSKKELYDLARYGYFLPVQPGNGDSEDFIHSDQFVLVDRQLHIRGYYNGTDSTAVDSLISDIRILLKEK